MAEKFKGKKDKNRGRKVSSLAKAAAKADPAEDRGEEFELGKWRTSFVGCTETDGGAYCMTLKGAGKHAKIGERIGWFSTKGKAVHVSSKVVKRLAMILAGIDDKDEYLEFDPNGDFLDALLGGELETAAEYMAENGKAKSAEKALAKLEAAEFWTKATKGGDKDDGGFFVNLHFQAIGDEDSDDSDDSDNEEDEDEDPPSERRPAKGKRKPSRDEDEDDEDDEDEDDEEDEDEDDSDDEEDEDEDPPSERKPSKKAKRRK